jgi:type II secretion system protein N
MSLIGWKKNKAKINVAFWQRPSIFLLIGIVLMLLGLMAGVYLFFPAETLKQRIIQEAEKQPGVELHIEQLTFIPLLNLSARGLMLGLKGLPQPLPIDELSIAPLWSTLLTDNPGLQLQGHLMNGSITAGVLKSGAISAAASGLRFNLPLQQPLPLTIKGTLNDADIEAATRLDSGTKTSMLLHLSDVSIHGLELLKADGGSLVLGNLTLETEGQGRSIRVKTMSARGGDFIVNGDGTLLIGRTAASSRIKLELQVSPGPNADPSLASLLELAGAKDGEGRHLLQLTGTLAKPLLKPGG